GGEAAGQAGWTDDRWADGYVGDLVGLIEASRRKSEGPVLYLAGQDRASDLVGELLERGMAVEMRVVYRAVTMPLPESLIDALKSGEIDAVLHFSRRSAENYVAGAKSAGVVGPALAVRHFCLSAQVAEPLAALLVLRARKKPR